MAELRTGASSFLTLAGEGTGTYRDKASKFIGYAFPISDEIAFKARLAELMKEHFDARHHCYAYVLGNDGAVHRNSDAGEPSGTAGKPILRHLQGRSLTYAAAVVVRWFGGTLLGKGGLVHAYGEAACKALDSAGVIERNVMVHRNIICTYAQLENVKTTIARNHGALISGTYNEACSLQATIPIACMVELDEHWRRMGIACTPIDVQSK